MLIFMYFQYIITSIGNGFLFWKSSITEPYHDCQFIYLLIIRGMFMYKIKNSKILYFISLLFFIALFIISSIFLLKIISISQANRMSWLLMVKYIISNIMSLCGIVLSLKEIRKRTRDRNQSGDINQVDGSMIEP